MSKPMPRLGFAARPTEPLPTPAQRAAAEALRDELARRLAGAAWLLAPAPAGWAELENA